MRPTLASIVAILVVVGASSPSSAAPACFSERITLRRIGVFDSSGELLGFVDENQKVHVLEEDVGLGGHYSRIELKVPDRLVGYVDSKRLGALAERDIPIQPGLSWWLKGTRFVVLAEHRGRAQVARAALDHDEVAGRSGDVPCSSLVGTPAYVVGRVAQGQRMAWPGTRRLESQTGEESAPLRGENVVVDDKNRSLGLIERRGNSIFVELIDEEEGLKVRGWTTAEGVSTALGHPTSLACSCRDPASMWPLGGVRVRLSRAAKVFTLGDRQRLTRLPKGTEVRLQSVQGDMVLVYWSSAKDGDHERDGFIGLVSNIEFPAPLLSTVNVVVNGRCAPGSRPVDPRIRARFVPSNMDRAFVFNLDLSPDGSFSFVAPVAASSFIFWATSLDGLWVSKEVRGTLIPQHSGEASAIVTIEHKDP